MFPDRPEVVSRSNDFASRPSDSSCLHGPARVAHLTEGGRRMMRTLTLAAGTLITALAFSMTDAQAASGIPKAISAAVANPARPEDDRQRDVDRKPAESVAFAGVK